MAYVNKSDIYKLFDESNGVIKLHIADVDMLPTADVVEVVRCKDCIKRDTDDCWIAFYCEDGELFCDTLDNDYCGRGERKDT